MAQAAELDLDTSSPDEMNAVAAALMTADPIKPQEPPDTTVHLPGGWVSPEGITIKEVEVRELNGEDEEYFAKDRWGDSIAKMITSVLHRGVVTLGDLQPPPVPVLKDLLVGDRLALFIGIRRVTYGNDLPISLVCPACQTTFEVAVELDSLDTKELESERIFSVSLRNGGEAEVVMLNGAVQEEMETVKTVAEQNTIALARCIKKLNGSPIVGLDAARRLGSLDRKTILEAMLDRQPGPRLNNIEVPCTACGEVRSVTLAVTDIFRI